MEVLAACVSIAGLDIILLNVCYEVVIEAGLRCLGPAVLPVPHERFRFLKEYLMLG